MMSELNINVIVINYGIGNVGSVVNACRRAGATPIVVNDGDDFRRAEGRFAILPGVGAVGRALELLRARGIAETLEQRVIGEKMPFLGICVGMQVLTTTCQEFGEHKGLGWISGTTRPLQRTDPHLKLPHIGWNLVHTVRKDPLLQGLKDAHFYFAHSFAVECSDALVLASCSYGDDFTCVIRKENILAVQFHPEKSSHNGVRMLQSFFAQ